MSPRSTSGLGLFFTAGLAALTLAREGVCDNARETARLAYTTPAEVPGCPDETSFRNLVAARLGYDPFVVDGRHSAAVSIAKNHGKLVVRARVTRQGQTEPGVRELSGAPDQCEALALALATTVAIALDPVRGLRGPETGGSSGQSIRLVIDGFADGTVNPTRSSIMAPSIARRSSRS